jgi:hypothetical protein
VGAKVIAEDFDPVLVLIVEALARDAVELDKCVERREFSP